MTNGSKINTFDKLNTKRVLRRYMDLPKFLDLLYTKELYVRRADGFSDRLEGALFPLLRQGLDEFHREGTSEYTADEFYTRARRGNYVSCWNMSAKDSMALWQLYGGVKHSVVVTTTIEKLMKTAWYWERESHFAKVKYINHKTMDTFIFPEYKEILEYKNKAYKFESELRVIIPQQDTWESNKMGMRLPIKSINELIRSVVFSPEASDGFYEAIKDLCKKYGVSSPVNRSALYYVPV